MNMIDTFCNNLEFMGIILVCMLIVIVYKKLFK